MKKTKSSTQNPEAQLMTKKALARLLGLSEPTTRRLIREDPTVPRRVVAGRELYPRPAVEAWLAERGGVR